MVARNRMCQVKAATVCLGIVTRNRSDILPNALISVLAQGYPNLKVAVIDDGSSDATPELRAKFPEVDWSRRSSALGYVSARNEMMARQGSKYFVSLDDDAWFLHGDEIAIAVEFLENNQSVAAIAFDILSADHPRPAPGGGARQAAMFIGCGHVLRLSAVREVGGYEPVPGHYGGEEKDLCLRLLDAGYKIMKLSGVHVWHDKTTVARHVPTQHRSGVCNDLAMALRRTPATLLPAAILVKFYRHTKFSIHHGLMRPCLEGFALFIQSIPAIWHSRRPVRAATLQAFMRLARS